MDKWSEEGGGRQDVESFTRHSSHTFICYTCGGLVWHNFCPQLVEKRRSAGGSTFRRRGKEEGDEERGEGWERRK